MLKRNDVGLHEMAKSSETKESKVNQSANDDDRGLCMI